MTAPTARTVQIDADDLERLCQVATRGTQQLGFDYDGLPFGGIPALDPDDRWFIAELTRTHHLHGVTA